MKPIYLIVHPRNITPYDKCNQPKINAELERLLKEEDCIIQHESTGQISANMSSNRPIKVCGIYKEICVWQVWNDLVTKGYKAEIYDAASFNAP